MKRAERSHYVIPALRHKTNQCEDMMESQIEDRSRCATEAASMETNILQRHGSLRKRYSNTVPKQVRFDISSSYNSKTTSNKSSEEDSSDFEDCCGDIVAIDNLRMEKETTEDDSNDLWNKVPIDKGPKKNDPCTNIGNFEVGTKSSNELLMTQKYNLDLKYLSTQELGSGSNEKKFDKDLFYNYGDSNLSDIEAVIASYTKRENVLTSTPNSDIAKERILDAAKCVTQGECPMQSILLVESEKQTTIITNKNYSDYNFESFDGHSLVKKQLKDYSEVFGCNYIPPPVPPANIFRLPPIHRLPSPFSSAYKLSGEHLAYHQPSMSDPVSFDPSVPHTIYSQPCVSRAVSPQPCASRAVSPQPCVSRAVSPQPCVSRAVSLQPCVSRAVSPQLYVPRAASLQSCAPLSVSPQPSRTASPQSCAPLSVSPQPFVPRSVFPQTSRTASQQSSAPQAVSPQPCVSRAVSPLSCVPGSLLKKTHVSHFLQASELEPLGLQPPAFHPTFIQPPVPRPVSPRLSASNSDLPQHMPQLFKQLRHPRLLHPPSLQLFSDSAQYQSYESSYVQPKPSQSSSPYMRYVSNPNSPETLYGSSATLFPEERTISPHSYRDTFKLLNFALYNQDSQFYIPPPVPPPWKETKSADLLA